MQVILIEEAILHLDSWINDLTNAHYSYDGHTIQNEQVLDDEAAVIWNILIVWEEKYQMKQKTAS